MLGSIAPLTGLHPLALAAGSGGGSGSMLSAPSGPLNNGRAGAMAQQVLSIPPAPSPPSSALAALSLTYLGLPLAEKIYALTAKGEKA